MDPLLDWLIDPLPVDAFFADVWGAASHHVKRDRPDYFDRLHGVSTVDDVLEHVRTDAAAVRAVRGVHHKPAETYRLADGTLDTAGVRRDFAGGYTLVVDRLERYARSMTTMCHTLEVELNFPVQVNAYLSPPGATGFLPHYDHHDVLILQVMGAKTWHLHGDTAVPPHEMQRHQEFYPDALPPPSDSPIDVSLAAGDTFYLPRGQVHSAETTDEPSIHLTVGLHVPTALTLLTHTLYQLSLHEDRIHTRLPPRHLDDPGKRAGLKDLLRDALGIVEDPGAIGDGLAAMESLLVRRGQCPPVGQPDDVIELGPTTQVARYRPLYSRIATGTDGVTLQFAQFSVNLTPEHRAALCFISESTTPFRVGDLPGLTEAEQTELTKTLIISGFLVRA